MINCWGIAEYLSLLTLVVLTITACVVAWYSWETRKQRLETGKAREETERAREIEFHPWLVGSNLKTDPQAGHDILIWLPIKNAGKTPALNVSFDSEFFIEGKRTDVESYKSIFIAPDDTAHFRITRFKLDDQSKKTHVTVAISYLTHLKGSGSIRQEFQYEKGDWRNKEGEYTFILSTGEKYPK
jgi:hypothetical protein